MKILLLLFQVAVSDANSHQSHHQERQINSTRDLPGTVQTLVTALGSDNFEVPSSFLTSKKEKNAERQIKIANDNFRNTKEKIGSVKDLISWDTIQYLHDNTRTMDITLLLNTINPTNRSINKSHVVMIFRVNGTRLIMNTCRKMTDQEYDLHIINAIDEDRRTELYRKYKHYVFDNHDTKFIPFRNNEKWGLISLDSQVVVPAQYDSISKPEFGYYHVISKKGHNLLDKDLKPVFDKPQKNIRAGRISYEVLNINGAFENYGIKETGDPKATRPTGRNGAKAQTDEEKKLEQELKIAATHHTVVTYDSSRTPPLYNIRTTRLVGDSAITNILLKEFYTGKYVTREGYVLIYDKRARLFGVYCPSTNLLIQPIYRCIIPIDRDHYFIVLNKSGVLAYVNSRGKDLF